ncbi:probable transcriptional regulator SLK2 [Rutidosis leptorrhynchoides]|uniref:probable transcriptional regulator SLK2 n=1 Tax=Rutidosis leptorrhynchoides TaxID=125765 RepID=UPI003A991808
MVVTAGRQLARSLELQSLNDLGFSKRYVRSLQISEVVNSMKDLMDFCRDTKAGPIEGLKDFLRQTRPANNSLNNNNDNNNQMCNRSGSTQAAALALSNYQSILMRQSSMNLNSQQEASSSYNNTNPNGY